MKRKLTSVAAGFVGLGALTETVLAAGTSGSATLFGSTVCMSAPMLIGIVLTPTAAIGESLSAFAKSGKREKQ